MRRALAACVALALSSAPAVAQEPTFEALGQASIVGGDRVRARERALDEAMRQAVEQAVAALLEPKVVSERAAQLKLDIYPRARGFVATYRVLDESEQGAIFQMRIEAQVDSARLARAVQAPQAVSPQAAPRARAVVCVTVERDHQPLAPSGEEKRIAKALAARAVDAALLAGQCAPLVAGPGGARDDLDDAQAAAAAKRESAQGALVGTLKLGSDGVVRGTSLALGRAQARFHLVDGDGRALAAVDSAGDAWDASAPAAEDAAAAIAVDNALRALGPQLGARWPAGGGAGGGLVVHVAGVARFAEYNALVRALAAIPGVGAVSPRRFDASGIDLQVRTSTGAPAIAAALVRAGDAAADGTRFAAEPMGDLELKVRVTSPPPPEPAPLPPAPPPSTVSPPG